MGTARGAAVRRATGYAIMFTLHLAGEAERLIAGPALVHHILQAGVLCGEAVHKLLDRVALLWWDGLTTVHESIMPEAVIVVKG